jgi:hypothetical protein
VIAARQIGLLGNQSRILCVHAWRTSEVNDEKSVQRDSDEKTGLIRTEIYFCAQVFHRMCTPR